MRTVLLHNASAGSELRTDDELQRELRSAGHEVVATIARPEDLPGVLAPTPPELVVAAGGDGTVGQAAVKLAGTGVPLAILPLGTANNFARTLSIQVEGAELPAWIDAWSHSTPRCIDLALATAGDERKTFMEAVGFGLFPEVMRRSEQGAEPPDAAQALQRDLTLFRRAVEAAKPAHYALQIDGRAQEGAYLLVEIMNIPFLGPNLPIAASSHPGDGLLELCLVREEERPLLLEMIEDVRADRPSKVVLPMQSARKISVRSTEPCHLDGKHWPEPCGRSPSAHVEVSVQPGVLRVLAP